MNMQLHHKVMKLAGFEPVCTSIQAGTV